MRPLISPLGVATLAVALTACSGGGVDRPAVPYGLRQIEGARPTVGVSISVAAATVPSRPVGYRNIPDQHTSVIQEGSTYRVYFAGLINGVHGSAGVLDSSDFQTFAPSPGYGVPVFKPPAPHCKNDVFDAYYAAPGSVLPDPAGTRLMMIYLGENHYYGALGGCLTSALYYATVGFTESFDDGKTWRPGVPILGGPEPKPNGVPPDELGDTTPSAVIDQAQANIYVFFVHHGAGPLGQIPPDYISAARAALPSPGADPEFFKWDGGGFTSPGLGPAAVSSPVLTNLGACDPTQNLKDSGISYNDALGVYLLTMTCTEAGTQKETWAFSTATSLDAEDWTAPEVILGSDPKYPPSVGDWGPSFITPGAAPGHTGLTGIVLYAHGMLTQEKVLRSRPFTICLSSCSGPRR